MSYLGDCGCGGTAVTTTPTPTDWTLILLAAILGVLVGSSQRRA